MLCAYCTHILTFMSMKYLILSMELFDGNLTRFFTIILIRIILNFEVEFSFLFSNVIMLAEGFFVVLHTYLVNMQKFLPGDRVGRLATLQMKSIFRTYFYEFQLTLISTYS